MRRMILTLALAVGMVLGGASVALAHENPPATPNSPFNVDNAVAKKGLTTAKGPQITAFYDTLGEELTANRGIVLGYFAHSPTCGLHPEISH